MNQSNTVSHSKPPNVDRSKKPPFSTAPPTITRATKPPVTSNVELLNYTNPLIASTYSSTPPEIVSSGSQTLLPPRPPKPSVQQSPPRARPLSMYSTEYPLVDLSEPSNDVPGDALMQDPNVAASSVQQYPQAQKPHSSMQTSKTKVLLGAIKAATVFYAGAKKEMRERNLERCYSESPEILPGDPLIELAMYSVILSEIMYEYPERAMLAKASRVLHEPIQWILQVASKDNTVSWMVSVSHASKRINVSFRGSASSQDWYINIETTPLQFTGSLGFHQGMFASLQNYYPSHILPLLASIFETYHDYSLVLTGHSLGGGYATILYFRLHYDRHMYPSLVNIPIFVVTFGAPIVTHSLRNEDSLAEEVAPTVNLHNIFHFVHGRDIVPRVMGGKTQATAFYGLDLPEKMGEIKNYRPLGRFFGITARQESDITKLYECTGLKGLFLEIGVSIAEPSRMREDHGLRNYVNRLALLQHVAHSQTVRNQSNGM